jgi:hypothetical protein
MTKDKLAVVDFTLTSTTGAAANNTDTNDITATLIADGDHQYGIDILFSITEPRAAFSNNAQTITATTDALGKCTVQLHSLAEGKIKVSGICSFAGESQMTAVESEFGAQVDTMVLTGTVQTDNARADGQTANRIVYSVMQGTAPAVGQFLTFDVISSSGNAKLSASFGQTDSSGNFILDITNTTAESVLVTAKSATDDFPSIAKQVTFVPVATSYTLESLIMVNGMQADGVSENKILFILKNSLGNTVPQKLLQFIPSTNLSLHDSIIETDASGSVTLSCTSLQEGVYSLTAVVYGEDVEHRVANITFVKADELDALTGIVLKNNATADGEDYCEIQYRLTKKTQDVVANQQIEIELNSVTAYASAHTLTTDYAGIATVKVFDTEAEDVVVSAYTKNQDISARTKITFGPDEPEQPESITFTGTFTPGTHGIDEMIPVGGYNFVAGRMYQFITDNTYSSYCNYSDGIYINGSCISYPNGQPDIGAGFSTTHYFAVEGTFLCVRPGTKAYFRNYAYRSSYSYNYTLTINSWKI